MSTNLSSNYVLSIKARIYYSKPFQKIFLAILGFMDRNVDKSVHKLRSVHKGQDPGQKSLY